MLEWRLRNISVQIYLETGARRRGTACVSCCVESLDSLPGNLEVTISEILCERYLGNSSATETHGRRTQQPPVVSPICGGS